MIKRPLLVNAFDRRSSSKPYPNVIMVTSSVQGEGKTFTSLTLAISITLELDSTVAKRILDNWDEEIAKFVRVMPRDYARVLRELEARRETEDNGAARTAEETQHAVR